MDIPIIVVCHNNYKYVQNTLVQIEQINPDYMKRIRIMDSKSSDPDTIAFLHNVSVPVLWNPTNSGPWLAPWVNVDIYNSMPDRFILTDPDLQFNPELPSDFIEQMCAIADRHPCAKIGFALDISEPDKMYNGHYTEGKSIWEHESQFWKDKIEDATHEIYKAAVDTTFSLHDKRYDYYFNQLRVAGKFTAKHIPWYRENPFYDSSELFAMYANKPISTFGRVILGSMSVTFVTAFIDLHDEVNSYRSPEKRIEFFKKLNDTGVRLHVFISPEHRDKIHVTNGVIETIELEDLDTYHLSPDGLPDVRNEIKDTQKFLILINSKIELVNRAINSGKHSSSHYAWIDFNIFHVLTDQSVDQFKRLSNARYPATCMYVPGCWNAQVLWDSINWRFCGGFFLGDIESLRSFYELQCKEYPKMPKLTWEVNTWAYLESLGWQCDWCLGDHNDSILAIPITGIVDG